MRTICISISLRFCWHFFLAFDKSLALPSLSLHLSLVCAFGNLIEMKWLRNTTLSSHVSLPSLSNGHLKTLVHIRSFHQSISQSKKCVSSSCEKWYKVVVSGEVMVMVNYVIWVRLSKIFISWSEWELKKSKSSWKPHLFIRNTWYTLSSKKSENISLLCREKSMRQIFRLQNKNRNVCLGI